MFVLLIAAVGYNGYMTHKIYKFIVDQQMPYNELLFMKSQCNGEMISAISAGIDDSNPMWSLAIDSCYKYLAHHQCWMLAYNDPISLDNCGAKFGLTQEEIETSKETKLPPERMTK